MTCDQETDIIDYSNQSLIKLVYHLVEQLLALETEPKKSTAFGKSYLSSNR